MKLPRPLASLLLAMLAWPIVASAQGGPGGESLPPAGYGSLTQSDLALRIRTDEIEVRMVPLDPRVTRLLARDSYLSLHGVVENRRRAIDSIAGTAGISRPGLVLVTFFGHQAGVRFDPQTLTLNIRNGLLRPLGIVPFTPRFNSQQLEVREQVTGIYVYEEELPVGDSFSFGYAGRTSEDWQSKQRLLDRERARVAARARVGPPDSAVRE